MRVNLGYNDVRNLSNRGMMRCFVISLIITAIICVLLVSFGHTAETCPECTEKYGTLSFQKDGSLLIEYEEQAADLIRASDVSLSKNLQHTLDGEQAEISKKAIPWPWAEKPCFSYEIGVERDAIRYLFILLDCH